MEDKEGRATVLLLPDEILTMILHQNSAADIVRFGLTCKRLYNFVSNSSYLWKKMVRAMIPEEVFQYIDDDEDANWMDIYKQYFTTQRTVYYELTKLVTSHYSRAEDLQLPDVKEFFDLAVDNSANYHYVVYLLQDLIKKANSHAEVFHCTPPFTLTEAYYAKDVLSYLMQIFLIVKWAHEELTRSLPPAYVLNWFVQWMDPLQIHSDEDVRYVIDSVVEMVEKHMAPTKVPCSRFERLGTLNIVLNPDPEMVFQMSIAERLAHGYLHESEVMRGITEVIYHQMRLVVVDSANLDTLDLVKVVKNKCGNGIVIVALYYAVATRFGISCDLIAFRDHLILQWNHTQDSIAAYHQSKLDVGRGQWLPKGRCPFANYYPPKSKHKYNPQDILKYVGSLFLAAKGYVRDWYYKNGSMLLSFIDNARLSDNPYRNFLPYLLEIGQLYPCSHAVEITAVHHDHLHSIDSLQTLNTYSDPLYKHMTVKRRGAVDIKYAVGMLCIHTKYEYLCVIVGWDTQATRNCNTDTLRYGCEQPFYHVVALDLSNRYIAQENLDEMREPYRLFHLEEVIAKEFTHFDGFSYVPNRAKRREYPDDEAVRLVYRSRFGLTDEAEG